jgi:HEAT repeat protein
MALGIIGDAAAVEPLKEALKDRDGDVQAAVQEALVKISK